MSSLQIKLSLAGLILVLFAGIACSIRLGETSWSIHLEACYRDGALAAKVGAPAANPFKNLEERAQWFRGYDGGLPGCCK